jgi:hypothetical protein
MWILLLSATEAPKNPTQTLRYLPTSSDQGSELPKTYRKKTAIRTTRTRMLSRPMAARDTHVFRELAKVRYFSTLL